jgi:selenocysteine lyase/cysteine desulfurase
MPDIIPCQRALFNIPEGVTYLNCAYISPLLKASAEAIAAGLARETRPWEILAEDFFSGPAKAKALFARLIGAQAQDIAIVPSASYGIATAAANLPIDHGQSILVLESQYPSNIYAWRRLAAERGALVKTVARPADGDWTAVVLEALSSEVAIAALPNCHWFDGGLVDLVRVSAAVKAQGVALVIDASQSLGAYPLQVGPSDQGLVEADFLATCGYKWMLCPYGVSFLYVAPRHQSGRGLEENPLNRKEGRNFARLADYRDDYAPGAARFDAGERAHFTLLPGAIAALEQLLAWGPENTAATIGKLNLTIARGAEELGLPSLPPEHRANQFLGLALPPHLVETLQDLLAKEGLHVSLRGTSLRITPHLYNDESDGRRLLEILASALKR